MRRTSFGVLVLATAFAAMAVPGAEQSTAPAGQSQQAPAPARPPQPQPRTPPPSDRTDDQYRFKSGVDLVNVTATVSDASGRFVPNLTKDDFIVYEDGKPQDISYFGTDRIPVSLGLVIDTSGSMLGEKIEAARTALQQFLDELLDRDDEIFLYRFSDTPVLLQGWTTDRALLNRALGRLMPEGGTAMYDAVAAAVPMARGGRNQKKALVIISDGNDTSSYLDVTTVNDRVRASELLVYAIGIDSDAPSRVPFTPPQPRQPRQPAGPSWPFPTPRPFPGGPGGRFPSLSGPLAQQSGGQWRQRQPNDRVNVAALRQITDDSGGRTEIVRDPHEIDPATRGIADELSHQYSLGYASSAPKDHKWHAIRVELRQSTYRVRYRRGYVAE